MSDSLRPHESQHARPPCPSPTPGVHSNSCPPSLWCHPAISSSVIPFSSCPQSLQDYHILNYIFHDHILLYNQHFLGSQPLHLPLWFGSNKQIVNYSNFHCNKVGFRFGLLAKEHSLSLCVLSRFSRVRLFVTLWTVAHKPPLSVGFSQQEYWSGLPCPPPGGLPNPGMAPRSPETPALKADSLSLSHRENSTLYLPKPKCSGVPARSGEEDKEAALLLPEYEFTLIQGYYKCAFWLLCLFLYVCLAVPGLSCSIQDLQSLLQLVGSLVAAGEHLNCCIWAIVGFQTQKKEKVELLFYWITDVSFTQHVL